MFYSPLKYSLYRNIWIATLVSNIGTWIHTVTASLLMAKLTSSAVIIAMVQTAAMLPIFLFAIPGGIIGDIYERKTIIICSHIFMSLIAALMAVTTYLGLMSDWLLLCSLFLLNIGLAFNQPAWQAIASRLIPKHEIKQSAVLNNLSFNVSRCIGPAIAGYLFSFVGPAPLFALNSCTFLGVIIIFATQVTSQQRNTPPFSFALLTRGFKDSLQLIKEIPAFKFIIAKSTCYFILASSMFALLPYIVLIQNKMGGDKLGLLTGAAGLGAVLNAMIIHRFRQFTTDDKLTTLAMFITSLAIYSTVTLHAFSLQICTMILFGFSWSLSISVFNGALQTDFPDEIRSKLLGVYFLSFASAQAIGSYISGQLAQLMGGTQTMLIIASLLVVFAIYCSFNMAEYKFSSASRNNS